MVSQMANPHHGDLELVRSKESSIWATNLIKEVRNDKELASNYLLDPQTWRKSCWKPSPPPLFFFFWILGSSSPEQTMEGQEVKEAHIFIYIFRAGSGVSRATLENRTHFQGLLREWAAPRNVIFRSGLVLQYLRPICRNGWLFSPLLKNFEAWIQIVFVVRSFIEARCRLLLLKNFDLEPWHALLY